MNRLDTAGSLGLCLSRPGLHIHQQLVVHAKFSRLQPALLLAELPDGRPCLQTHLPLSFECLFLTVSSLCKKLLSWSEPVTLLRLTGCEVCKEGKAGFTKALFNGVI